MQFQFPPLFFLLLLLTACGSGGGGDVEAPTVSETNPSNQATNVPVDSDIRAKFSGRIDPVTVNEKNFFILDASGPMAGKVTYQDKMAIFKPGQPLGRGRQYNAVLTTGIKDLDGIPLPSNFTWSFVTEGEGGEDTIPPKIDATVPRPGENNVSHTAPILVVFSEPIDPNTIHAETFFIKDATGKDVPGSHTYDAPTRTAKFSPSTPLALSKTYQVTITTGIKDLSGNALLEGRTWSFRTARDTTPPRIEERSPGENANEVSVNSNIAVTFDEVVKRETLQSRFVLVGPSGEVQATFSYQASSSLATLDPITDLAGETTYRVSVRRGVEDLSGNATSADVSWAFTTGRVPDTTPPSAVRGLPQDTEGVSVKTLITAVFDEPIDASTLVGNFVVSSQAGNTLGEISYEERTRTATFTPSPSRLEYNTTYTVLLGSGIKDRSGNSLKVMSWTFTTIDPPQVTGRSPEGQGISTNPPPAIQAVFSREMNPSSINQNSFHLVRINPFNQQGTMVPGAVSYTNRIATFTPSVPLSDNILYRVTVTTAAEDVNGNPLPSNVQWEFRTAAPPDPAPTVVSTEPANGTTDVSVNILSISAQFQRPIDPSNLSSQFTVRETNGNLLDGSVGYDAGQQRAIFFTQRALAYNTSYTAVLGAAVRSVSGTPMGVDYVWTFTTEAAPDTTAPSMVGSDPAEGAQAVPVADPSGQPFQIRVDFSEPILASTVHAATFIVRRVDSEFDKPQLSGAYRTESSSAFFAPSLPYDPGKRYEVTLTTGITDLAGNPLPFDVIRTFTTAP